MSRLLVGQVQATCPRCGAETRATWTTRFDPFLTAQRAAGYVLAYHDWPEGWAACPASGTVAPLSAVYGSW